MHVMTVDQSKKQLRRNSAYYKMGTKADKKIQRDKHKRSDNDDIHIQLSKTYPFAIMMQLKSLEVTMTDVLQLSLKKVKISRIWNKMTRQKLII